MTATTELTSEQQLAISTRTVSVALSAGAGCGKTFVLTERFLSYFGPGLLQPDELGKLVAITFTDRAAREMRDRIRKKCFDRLQAAADAAAAKYWIDLARALDVELWELLRPLSKAQREFYRSMEALLVERSKAPQESTANKIPDRKQRNAA